jgi:hypothetical protein
MFIGHVLWKKRDFDGARSTYENAITQVYFKFTI